MKHLLIILSFLLLSSPVIGDNYKGETLYGWGEYPDYVWKGVGEKGTHSVYKGEAENGVPNGQGTQTYPDGEKYEGSWKNGVRWNGTEYDKDGNIKYKYVNGKQIKQ